MFLLCPKIYIVTLKVLFVSIILNISKKNCCCFFHLRIIVLLSIDDVNDISEKAGIP